MFPGYPVNNGLTFYINGSPCYLCTGCGLVVAQTNWSTHMGMHTSGTTAPAPVVDLTDVQARLRRLEDYVMNDERRLRDEIAAIKSVVNQASS